MSISRPAGLQQHAAIAIGAVVAVILIAVAASMYVLRAPTTSAPKNAPAQATGATSVNAPAQATDTKPLPDGGTVQSNGTIVRSDGVTIKPDGTIIGADGKILYSPKALPPKQAPAPTKVCVDNVMCIRGDHWSTTECKCVPN